MILDIVLPLWLTHLLKITAIILVAYFFNQIGRNFIERVVKTFLKNRDLKPDEVEQRAETLTNVFSSIFTCIVWVLAILTVLPEFGINIAPLLAGIGITGLALGMGAKNLIQDYINGVFIFLEDHFRVGETVEIGSVKGRVKEFDLRKTVIIGEKDKKTFFIPNSQIKIVSNLSRKK